MMEADVMGMEQVPDLESANRELSGLEPRARIAWALERFGEGLALSSSFGIQSAVLLHLATRERGDLPVIFVDTGYHFPETYQFVEALRERLDLNLKVYQPLMTSARQEALFGRRWAEGEEGLKAYNLQNKVEPMNRALRELGITCWMSGLRREQSRTREKLEVLQVQKLTFKLHPIVEWTRRDVHDYLTRHDLPYHPLWEKGYVSVGDWHSTSPLQPGMAEEETRFGGVKRECGLHETSSELDFQI